MFELFDLRRRRLQDLINAMGSMYAAIIFIGAQNGISIQEVVNIERTVSYRERAAGMYSVLPYAFAQVLIDPSLWPLNPKSEIFPWQCCNATGML